MYSLSKKECISHFKGLFQIHPDIRRTSETPSNMFHWFFGFPTTGVDWSSWRRWPWPTNFPRDALIWSKAVDLAASISGELTMQVPADAAQVEWMWDGWFDRLKGGMIKLTKWLGDMFLKERFFVGVCVFKPEIRGNDPFWLVTCMF